ncbi:hypothetical protein [Diaphorobacter sp.]|uniref:hypothetical protein n=1 Tax=Diaphorobacter sp. TaxID=1934310 RepID=UPI003D104A1D
MTLETATQKAAQAAHQVAGDVADTAASAAEATRRMANDTLDMAESSVRRLRAGADPLIDDLAYKAQDLASRSIDYCAQTSERARRQFHQAGDATTRYVNEQPGKSLLMAAAAGAALATLAMLLSRRGRD